MRLFGDAQARERWFAQMLLPAFQTTILEQYRPFGEHGRAALRMIAQQSGRSLAESDERGVLDGMRRLPAFPDVAPGLARLRAAGLRLVALTNSTEDVGRAQFQSAGILDQFDRVCSADRVRRLKPAPEPYRMVVQDMGVLPEGVWLVAAHGWDIGGATAIGCRTAFLARPGKVLDPLAAVPSLIVGGRRGGILALRGDLRTARYVPGLPSWTPVGRVSFSRRWSPAGSPARLSS